MRTRSSPASRTRLCQPRLPRNLQGKLDLPRRCKRRIPRHLTYAAPGWGSVSAKNCSVGIAAARLRRHEAGAVQDVEHLGSELNGERLRDSLDREVLKDR